MEPREFHGSGGRIRLFVLYLLCLGLFSPICYGEEVEGESSDGNLGQYYGFGPMEILKLEKKLGMPIVVDINHDGLNDIVVVNNRKARIELLLQKKDFQPGSDIAIEIDDEDINDIFGKERTWRFKRVSYPLDVSVKSLVVADLNDDNYLDMAYYASDGLRIVLQEVAKGQKDAVVSDLDEDGDGLYQPNWQGARKIDIREGLSSRRSLVAGDLNGDGLTDLALLAGDGVFLLYQNSDGTLASAVKHHSASDKLKQIHIADINGDGRNDMVLLTSRHEEFPLRIRFQSPAGMLGPEMRYHLPVPTVLEVEQLGQTKRSHIFSVSRQSGRLLMSIFPDEPSDQKFPVYTYPLGATDNSENRDMVCGDVDGDGLLDVIVSDPSRAEFILFRATADDSLTTPLRFPGLKDMRKLCAGDLDGSGKDTIVVLSFEEKLIAMSSLQKGRLSFPKTVAIVGEPQVMDLADINGDQQLDLIYIAKEKDKEKSTEKFFLRSVLSLGRKESRTGAELELTEIKDKPQDIRVADIDQDGRTDVMVIRSYEPLLLVRQKESGTFEQETSPNVHAGLVSSISSKSLSLVQLGSDEKIAALVVRKNFARALKFDPNEGWSVLDQYQAAHPQSNLTVASACRLAADKPINIVTYDNARGKLDLLGRQEDGTYRSEDQIDIGVLSVKKIVAGNFGGPTPVSLLVCGNNKLIRIPISAQAYTLREIATFEPDIKDGRFGALTVGDINNDGSPDIILCEQSRHHIQILTFDNEGALVSATKFKVFEQSRGGESSGFGGRFKDSGQPRYAVVGDVTGDSKNDLILLVHDRIIVYPQD